MKGADDEDFEGLLQRVARTPDVTAVRRDVKTGTELSGRFVLERKLGEGATGAVFAAFDRLRQARVALKLLGILTPRSIVSIKREFRVAAELVHPNLVRLHELFSDGPNWFFTMDLLDGATIDQLRAAGTLDADLLRQVMGGVALGLSELHRAGALHGDLKPSNFLVLDRSERAVLLDFGLARSLGRGVQEHAFAGTPAYMAPEQAAGARLSEAADWFSLGVVLFEALTGQLPIDGAVHAELEHAPEDLRALCIDLLRSEPEARPKREEVLRRLGSVRSPARVSSRPPPRSTLVGRSAELAYLCEALEDSEKGIPQLVLVRGDSGIGKTALVEHFIAELAGRGATVLSGRCRERESVSYKAVDGLIEDLIRFLEGLPASAVSTILPEGMGDLTRLFPTLRTVAAVAHSYRPTYDLLDQGSIKQHAIAAFRDLLAEIRRRGPLVVWLDDLQWGDAESAVLLEPLLAGVNPVPLLFIGSHRSIRGARGDTLDALFSSTHRNLAVPRLIDLSPLEPEDAERLARTLLPSNDPGSAARARAIAAEAGGHPLFIAELVHGDYSEPALRVAPAVTTLGDLVNTRLTALPPDVRGLLETAALAGSPITPGVARRARSLDPDGAERALDLLRTNRLVRTQRLGSEAMIDILHDRIREIVVQGVSPSSKQQHHRALARALEAEPGRNPEAVASHFHAAGDTAEAGRYWIEAGHVAFDSLAFGYAAKLFERGTELANLEEESLRALQVRRAEALAYAGEGAAAADVYLAVADSRTQEDAIELRRRAAEQLLLSGHLGRGLEVIEVVLRDLGMRRTRIGSAALLSILTGRALVRLRGLRFRRRTENELSRIELARVDASWTIACSLGVIDFLRGADFQNEHLLLALRAGEPRRLLRALTLEISYAATPGIGSGARTRALLSLADVLVAQVDDLASSGLVRVSQGVAAYLRGRFDEALTHCERAVGTLSRCSGTVWETVTAHRFIIASLFQLGRFGRLAEVVPPLLAEAEGKGNLYASMYFRTMYSNAAWLVRDDATTAHEQLVRARKEWQADGTQLTHVWMFIAEMHLAFYSGETERSWRRLEEVWPDFERAQFLRIGVLSIQLWYIRARCALAAARNHARLGQYTTARLLVREADAAAARLRRERLAHAAPFREQLLAAIDQARGNEASALERFGRAAARFEELDMRLYAASTRWRLGRLLGGQEGEAHERGARLVFASEGIHDCESMCDVLASQPPPANRSRLLLAK